MRGLLLIYMFVYYIAQLKNSERNFTLQINAPKCYEIIIGLEYYAQVEVQKSFQTPPLK